MGITGVKSCLAKDAYSNLSSTVCKTVVGEWIPTGRHGLPLPFMASCPYMSAVCCGE